MKQVKIVAGLDRANFLLGYQWFTAKTLSIEPSETSKGSYEVMIEFPDHYDVNLIAQVLFAAGVSYGLDLNYSSYDNDPARVR